jgi:mitotic spindle assembly checkpoint protein MAD2B
MNYDDIESALLEFVECVVHETLHLRHIYPAELFQRQRLYNIAVRKARHPKLNDYIHGVVQSIKVNVAAVGGVNEVAGRVGVMRFSVV